jgi:hypothetical protein
MDIDQTDTAAASTATLMKSQVPARPTDPGSNEEDAEIRVVLERRAAFDGSAWERALAERAEMASPPAPEAPGLTRPRPSSPPTITIATPSPPVRVGSLVLTGKAAASGGSTA